MDFEVTYTEEQQRFRREVRAWLEAHVPAGVTQTPASALAAGSRCRRRGVQTDRQPSGDRSDDRSGREHRDLDVFRQRLWRRVTAGSPAEQAALVNEEGAEVVARDHRAGGKA